MKISSNRLLIALLGLSMVLASGCVRVKVDPIKVEPIYIEITVNHKIQKELDDIFADIDKVSETIDYKPLEEK